MMDLRLVQLAHLLRHHGLRVGPGEVEDAARALRLVELSERSTVSAALCACLVKRASDVPTFDRVFRQFFEGAAEPLDAAAESLVHPLERSQALGAEEVAALKELAAAANPALSAVLEGDRRALAQALDGALLGLDLRGLESRLQVAHYSRRLLAAAGAQPSEQQVAKMLSSLSERGAGPQVLELVSRAFAEALRRLEEAARRTIAREVAARRRRGYELEDRPFAQLSAAELARVATAVRRLGERLKARLVQRERTRRGALHVRRMLRKNLGWGGVPVKLAFRRRRPIRPDVVILCDVSDSVRNVTRMMLLFVHTLQSQLHRVRTFAFVSDVGEVTDAFRAVDVRQAVDVAVAGRRVNLYANSDYGQAFGQFAQRHLAAVGRKTTVLVIGDGRTNYHSPNLLALREIKRLGKRLVWICPEDRRAWGTGDSAMLHYAALCDRVATVQSLADLQEVAHQLVPRS